MPRAREFDPALALNKAMGVFWQKGYANTSIDDLVAATGVNRYGLYAEFESKRGLFLTCLDHYQNEIVEMAFGVVEQPSASLSNIRDYFNMITGPAPAGRGEMGCLMINTANDVAAHDKRTAKKVEKYRARLQSGFRKALSNAKANGELAARVDVEQMADFLIGVVQGLSVMIRSRAQPKMIANVVTTALSCLE